MSRDDAAIEALGHFLHKMAGLTPTLPTAYSAAQLRFNTSGFEFEQRRDNYNALAAFVESSPGLLSADQVNQEKQSFERDVQIHTLKKMTISLIDGRLCDFDGDEASTDKIILSWSLKGFRVKVPIQTHLKDNTYAQSELLANALYNAWHTWYEFMENLCISYLEANKATVVKPATPYFTATGGVYSSVKGVDFYSAYQYALSRNFLNQGGNYLDVASSNAQVTRTLMGMNAAGNAVNQAMLVQGSTFFPTNFVIPAGGYTEVHYLFPRGAVGIYPWTAPVARDGHIDTPEKDFWFTESDPIFGYFNAAVHFKHKCVDKTIGHANASEPTYYDIYEYSVDFSLLKAYSSVAGENPIIKFGLTDEAA